eukprot:s796_g20.t1
MLGKIGGRDPGNLRCWDKISATQAVYIFDGVQFERKAFRPSVDLYLRKMPFMKGAQVKNFVAPLDITWRRVEAEATSPK